MINAFIVLEETLRKVRTEHFVERGLKFEARGRKLCRAIYGAQFEPMIARMRRLHPELARWILREGYGKVLGRRPLDAGTRELLIVPMLAALGGHTQLFFHARGALRLGVPKEKLMAALRAARGLIRSADYRRAARVVERLSRRAGLDAHVLDRSAPRR